ncbi:MAG: hypothetical protein LBL26_11645 [Peptococcaceae bacterium]|nr:hypothetical protein [Peptococcaceae bacterium]
MAQTVAKEESVMTDLQFKALIKMVYERFVVEIHSGKDPEQLEAALKKWVETVAGVEIEDDGYGQR